VPKNQTLFSLQSAGKFTIFGTAGNCVGSSGWRIFFKTLFSLAFDLLGGEITGFSIQSNAPRNKYLAIGFYCLANEKFPQLIRTLLAAEHPKMFNSLFLP